MRGPTPMCRSAAEPARPSLCSREAASSYLQCRGTRAEREGTGRRDHSRAVQECTGGWGRVGSGYASCLVGRGPSRESAEHGRAGAKTGTRACACSTALPRRREGLARHASACAWRSRVDGARGVVHAVLCAAERRQRDGRRGIQRLCCRVAVVLLVAAHHSAAQQPVGAGRATDEPRATRSCPPGARVASIITREQAMGTE